MTRFEAALSAEHERAEQTRRRYATALDAWPPIPWWPLAANTVYRIRFTIPTSATPRPLWAIEADMQLREKIIGW